MTCTSNPDATFTFPASRLQTKLIPEAQIPVVQAWESGNSVVANNCTSGYIELVYSEGIGPLFLVEVGSKNEMTFGEVLSSGVWVLDLHSRINKAGWTFPVLLVIVAVVIVGAIVLADMYGSAATLSDEVSVLRFYLYIGALIGFTAGALEGITHLGIAQMELVRVESEFGEAFALTFLPNLLAIVIILVTMYVNAKWVSSPVWAPLEFLTAFSFLTFFYAGFYVGPSFWMAAALVRLYRLLAGNDSSLYKY